MKLLIIDGQIFQTDAWYRGMGKYTLQLLKYLDEKAHTLFDIKLLLNLSLDCNKDRINVIKMLCPNIELMFVELPVAKNKNYKKEDFVTAQNTYISKIAKDNEATIHLLPSIFSFDFFAEFYDKSQKVLLAYDIIPLLFWKELGGYFPQQLYMTRFNNIYTADLILSISETTKQDFLRVFGLSTDKVSTINGGYTKISDTPKRPNCIEEGMRYILFPSGDLPHKNNANVVRGFEEYIKTNGSGLKLIITSSFSSRSKDQLRNISRGVIFSNNVPDEELEWLYQHADVIVFGSLYEGLGLPVLDAVANNKPIVVSEVDVFKEMSNSAFYFFEPDNPLQLAKSIKAAINGRGFKQKTAQYRFIMDKYRWENTVDQFMSSINSLAKTRYSPISPENLGQKIAIVSLNPGIPNQIGRLAEPLYNKLIHKYYIDYFFDGNGYMPWEMERPTFLDFVERCKVMDISKLTIANYQSYDIILYLIDDAAFPSRAMQRAFLFPGIVAYNLSSGNSYKKLKNIVMSNQLATVRLQNYNVSQINKIERMVDNCLNDRQRIQFINNSSKVFKRTMRNRLSFNKHYD
jgi:glycosyltransferase involved in cell wall biosynthesis